MLFSQIEIEYKWLNLNPKCIFIFCERPSRRDRDRLELEELYPGFRFIFLPFPSEIDFGDNQVHRSFFVQNVVARVFPVDNSDFSFLAEELRPYSFSMVNSFMRHLDYLNEENKRRHFASFKEDFPFEDEIDDILLEEGVWSIDESITYVKSFIKESADFNSRVLRPRENTPRELYSYNYGFLRLEKVEPEKYGRRDSTDGWYRLMFKRSESSTHETIIKFPTALSKILYLFMLKHSGERFTYSEMYRYRDEIYAIVKAMYNGKKNEKHLQAVVNSLTHYGNGIDPTNDELSECRKGIRNAFQEKLSKEDSLYYEIQDDRSNVIRSRYLNIPKGNIDLTVDFEELVDHYKRNYSETEYF